MLQPGAKEMKEQFSTGVSTILISCDILHCLHLSLIHICFQEIKEMKVYSVAIDIIILAWIGYTLIKDGVKL